MTREEHWRQRLIELMTAFGLTQVGLADKTGVDASYLSRLLYPPEKKGRKNLGVKVIDKISIGLGISPSSFDDQVGTPFARVAPLKMPASRAAVVPVAQEHRARYGAWPFQDLTPQEWDELTSEQQQLVENTAVMFRLANKDSKQPAPAKIAAKP